MESRYDNKFSFNAIRVSVTLRFIPGEGVPIGVKIFGFVAMERLKPAALQTLFTSFTPPATASRRTLEINKTRHRRQRVLRTASIVGEVRRGGNSVLGQAMKGGLLGLQGPSSLVPLCGQ